MNNTTKLALAIAAMTMAGGAWAATETSDLTVDATLTTGCEVSTTSTISFGDIIALNSTGNTVANTDGTFTVACSASATPLISASATREMINGANTLVFTLSQASGISGASIPVTGVGSEAVSLVKDGTAKPVTLYATVLAANFRALPSGVYTNSASPVVVTVAY